MRICIRSFFKLSPNKDNMHDPRKQTRYFRLAMCCCAFGSLVCASGISGEDVAVKATAGTMPPVPELKARLLEELQLSKGAAEQGLALTAEHYFTSTAHSICRFDTQWKLLEEKAIRIDGVNHLGAIHHHDGFLWVGLLNGPQDDKYDKANDRAIVAKIRASDLSVVQTWDITKDLTWIDPVCFDGQHLWVGDLRDLGIHRYRTDGHRLVRDGVLRYPKPMHFSQGLRVVGKKLYSIHTFGEMKGLFEFDLPDTLTAAIQQPTRFWKIQETTMHLEGFDFIPGRPNELWHAQGKQVDRYELNLSNP